MNNKDTLKKHLETLELDIDATLPDIKNAYGSLKSLYSTDSIATSPLMNEISEEKRERILEDIELAYKTLSVLHIKEELTLKSESAVEPPAESKQTGKKRSGGSELRHTREAREIDLKEVADSTYISKRHLLNIEDENFAELPARIYLKGFIVSYAKYLGLDAEEIANSILKKFEIWQQPENDDTLE